MAISLSFLGRHLATGSRRRGFAMVLAKGSQKVCVGSGTRITVWRLWLVRVWCSSSRLWDPLRFSAVYFAIEPQKRIEKAYSKQWAAYVHLEYFIS